MENLYGIISVFGFDDLLPGKGSRVMPKSAARKTFPGFSTGFVLIVTGIAVKKTDSRRNG